MTARLAAILGCAGEVLNDSELALIREARPVGLILFARNCASPTQVRRLVDSWKEAAATDEVLVLIDQEGGRVCRLTPPHWRKPPPAAAFGRLASIDAEAGREAARTNARLIAAELVELGVNVDCIPVLDVPVSGAHDIVGDRAFSADPAVIADLGEATCEGLLDGGVLPVIKHIPGHGRATADSHVSLPVVEAARDELEKVDFTPFKTLADMPLAMTAHVVYTALDPGNPATVSPDAIGVIRSGIGFDGLLMTDDLSMKALPGSIAERARRAREAGCDVVLHCNGEADEMTAVAENVGALDIEGRRRLERALSWVRRPGAFDVSLAVARVEGLLSEVGEGASA